MASENGAPMYLADHTTRFPLCWTGMERDRVPEGESGYNDDRSRIGDKGSIGGRTGERTPLPCDWVTLSKEISHLCSSYVEYLVAGGSRSGGHMLLGSPRKTPSVCNSWQRVQLRQWWTCGYNDRL